MTERAFNSGVRRFVSFGVVAIAVVWFAAGFLACLNIFALRREDSPRITRITQIQKKGKLASDNQCNSCNPWTETRRVSPRSVEHGRGGSLPPFPAPANHLFTAIRRVESGGNDRAVGDGGRSRGPYQIGKAYWQDACEFGGVVLDYETLVWSRPHCERVMRWYWLRYGAETDCERAILHNAGPRGLAYWRRVVHELHELHEAEMQDFVLKNK